MKTLLILNDPPYGTERSYNGLRLAQALAKREGEAVRLFLMGDAVACAVREQRVPQGHYNLELMLGTLGRHGGAVGVCGSCMDARGIAAERLVDGAHRGSMEELAAWTLWADRAMAF